MSTLGIIFIGTPHQGSSLVSWPIAAARLLDLSSIKQTNAGILEELRRDSADLRHLQESFHHLLSSRETESLPQIHVACCFEELPIAGSTMVGETSVA